MYAAYSQNIYKIKHLSRNLVKILAIGALLCATFLKSTFDFGLTLYE